MLKIILYPGKFSFSDVLTIPLAVTLTDFVLFFAKPRVRQIFQLKFFILLECYIILIQRSANLYYH